MNAAHRADRAHRATVGFVAVWLVVTGAAAAADLTMVCGASEAWSIDSCRGGAARFEAATGHHVHVVAATGDGAETLRHLQELLAAESAAVDVLQLDIVWTGVLAKHLLDLGDAGRRLARQQVAAAQRAGDVQNRQVALPIYVDVGALFYRRDLVGAQYAAPPATWRELRLLSGAIRGDAARAGRTLDGFVFQGRAYEGLVCNLMEWAASHGVPDFIGEAGPRLDTPRLRQFLGEAATWIGETVPRPALDWSEGETLAHFAAGEVAFMRHWASAAAALVATAPEIAAVTEITLLPALQDDLLAGTLGGWMMAASAYSRQPEAATELVLHMGSVDEQRRRADEEGLIPAAAPLLSDPAIQALGPHLAAAPDLLEHAVLRPSAELGPAYIDFSREVAAAVHAILAGDAAADVGLPELQQRLDRWSGGGQRW